MKNLFLSSFFQKTVWLVLGLVACSNPSGAQFLPANRAITWSPATVGVPPGLSAVYSNGVPFRTVIYTNAIAAGCDATGVRDCSGILSSLIANCPSNQVVYLPAGTYMISNMISWRAKSYVTLRGAGIGRTFLVGGASSSQLAMLNLGTGNPEGYVGITSGSSKGSSNLVVAATSAPPYSLFPGCMIKIFTPDDTNFVYLLKRSGRPSNESKP